MAQHQVTSVKVEDFPQFSPPPRLLLGPGPSNTDPRVSLALAMPEIGHLDPVFVGLMSKIQQLLRHVWQTKNQMTIPVSGTGSAAMEACMANLVEPGDTVLIFSAGYFAERLCDMASRYGANLITIKKPWGNVFSHEEIKTALEAHKPKVMGIIHAETSTGACQPIEGLGDLCHQHDCLLVIDTVTSLGGVPVFLDAWGVDAAYSCTQKCLSCPPGLGPLTFSDRAMKKIAERKTRVANWYLDISSVSKYWGSERTYHHTAPINMNYCLYEGLRIIIEEGLENRWKRHRENAEFFWKGLKDLGLECHVEEKYRLPTLTTVKVPEGVDSKAVAGTIREKYNIEIAAGLGELNGKVWRIGLMGFNSRKENVVLLLAVLKDVLSQHQSK
jgi:alanine-glyoxylate transaminase/serine-glyoxylate transaminase/serine-pyruvate transaminase